MIQSDLPREFNRKCYNVPIEGAKNKQNMLIKLQKKRYSELEYTSISSTPCGGF